MMKKLTRYQRELTPAFRLIRLAVKILSIITLIFSIIIFNPVSASSSLKNRNTEHTFEEIIFIPLVGNSISLVGNGDIYYLSPTGDDNKSGRSEVDAWASFDHAWQYLYPGDTLILLDGMYYQILAPNVRNGEPGNPITIKAKNDGKAIIDGQHQRMTVSLKHQLNNWWVGNWFVIEGIIARNSYLDVYTISGEYNILRSVSGYNANTDGNFSVYHINGNYNLLEDCIAAGTGRKMIVVGNSDNEHNIVRRCFADWQEWDGREWHDCWPWGDGIDIYNANYNIIENSISYSRNPTQSFIIRTNGERSEGNKILGSMAILSGMKEDGTLMVWGDTRPQPTEYDCVRNFNWPGQRSGFFVWESGAPIKDNLWQDIFSWGNAGLGISWATGSADPDTNNNRIVRATVFNNGLNNPDFWGGVHIDARQAELDKFDGVENSFIEKIHTGSSKITMNGEGARLTHRYIDGELTSEPLWPWPMEDRIQAELGFSVTDLMTNIIFGTSELAKIYPLIESGSIDKD